MNARTRVSLGSICVSFVASGCLHLPDPREDDDASGGAAAGGHLTGGAKATGGAPGETGGYPSSGGAGTGGEAASGNAAGGNAAGGAAGAASTGGAFDMGGEPSFGGEPGTGGLSSGGGSSGGAKGTGGAATVGGPICSSESTMSRPEGSSSEILCPGEGAAQFGGPNDDWVGDLGADLDGNMYVVSFSRLAPSYPANYRSEELSAYSPDGERLWTAFRGGPDIRVFERSLRALDTYYMGYFGLEDGEEGSYELFNATPSGATASPSLVAVDDEAYVLVQLGQSPTDPEAPVWIVKMDRGRNPDWTRQGDELPHFGARIDKLLIAPTGDVVTVGTNSTDEGSTLRTSLYASEDGLLEWTVSGLPGSEHDFEEYFVNAAVTDSSGVWIGGGAIGDDGTYPFVARFDLTGALVFVTLDTPSLKRPEGEVGGLAVVPDGILATGGTTTNLAGTYSGQEDVFVLKLSQTGSVLAQFQFGGPDSERGTAITVGLDGRVYVGGMTNGPLFGAPLGEFDAFTTVIDVE